MNDFLESLYDAFADATIGIDPDTGRILHWNKAAAAMFGQSAKDVLGKTLGVVADEASFESFLSDIRKQGKGETQWQFRRGSDAANCHVEVAGALLRPPMQNSEYLLLVIRDPSLTEACLFDIVRERTKLLQLLQEIAVVANEASSIDDALEVTMDRICKQTSFPCPETALLVGHVHRRMTMEAAAPRADYWYLSDQDKLTPFRALSETICFDYGVGLIGRVLESRKLDWLADFAVDTTDPRAQEAKNAGLKTAIAFPVLAGEDIVAVMEIFTSEILAPDTPLLDALSQIGIQLGRIVERKRTEEKLRQNDLLATIGLTAAKLAHEISNPLNGMYTATQLLEQAGKNPKTSDADLIPSTVRDLKKEIERLRNLLYEFRMLSKPMAFDFELSNVEEVAREVVVLEGTRYARQGITIEMDFAADLPKIKLDREKIKQALLNLCQNAADAMPRGGKLTIRGYKLWGALCIEVCDTGPGLPERMNVFEIFATTKRGGTGLGLPIVQQIVSGHGGGVTFASEPGKGTVFRITLPINAKS